MGGKNGREEWETRAEKELMRAARSTTAIIISQLGHNQRDDIVGR